ncbi:TonB-dependent receptor [Spirosoma aureum]|uniref:TonB-dependent receptor n=1 Tax=Spirosoma aureum TaxID=2692134 RepID=A0A6G9AY09_9BACT|nr:TonB-dependent receptor [Spirosoma aureum]QIP17347.1 TonB-dependent receptor [Spirosoma aureum]
MNRNLYQAGLLVRFFDRSIYPALVIVLFANVVTARSSFPKPTVETNKVLPLAYPYGNHSQDIGVKGSVSDAKGDPLTGVSVVIKGTTTGTITDANGNYTLNVPDGNVTLVFSFIGFTAREIPLNNQSILNVVLSDDAKALEEVVVTGYSSQRKKDITGSVAIVKVSDLQSLPASTAENQLQGRAAGVTVISNNQPGSVSTVRIRGFASFTGNDPLYIVDGVPTGSLLGINPSDVESMQVLKDAASASIYGARASNGVIVVTTKKGKTGSAKVAYDVSYGIQDPGKGWTNMLNPQEYADLTWLALKNSGQPQQSVQYGKGATPVLPDYLLAGTASGLKEGDPATNPALYNLSYANLADANYAPYLIVKANKQGTNWWKEVTRKAPITNHNLTVSGGAPDKSRYLFSLNYFNQDGIVIENFYKRYSARINTEFTLKKNIRIGQNLQVYTSQANTAANNTEASELALARYILPIVPLYTIREGDFAGTKGNGLGTADNPVAVRERTKNNRANTFGIFGNMYLEVDFLKHFTARSSFGGSYGTNDYTNYPTIEYEGAENNRNPTLAVGFFKNRSWTWTNQLTYKNTFGDHSLQVLAGTEAVDDAGNRIEGSRSNYFLYTNLNAITLSSGTSNQLVSGFPNTPASLFSLFGKVDYEFKNKYIASVIVRRDGSSRFGVDNRYAVFPAGSLGWRISEEAFLKNVTWLTDLKLRGSYGLMGNQRIDPANQYTQFSTSKGAASYDIGGTSTTPQSGYYLSFIGNSAGKWETNVSTNVGFDATFFGGKTDISFDWYQKKTNNLLYTVEQLATAGGIAAQNPPFFNVGSMKNTGIDLAISQRANLRKVKLDATLTLTTYKNEITKIADGISYFDYNSPLNEQNRIGGVFTRNAVGHPINAYFGYDVIGLFQSADDVAKSPTQQSAAPGRFKYRDANGDGKIDTDDRVFFGNPNPKFTYGLNLNLSYKGFDLAGFFYGVQGRDAINYARFTTDFYSQGVTNKSKEALYNSWRPDNLGAKVPIQETVGNFSTNAIPNSYYKEDASYLRLKNLSLGYTLPTHLLNTIGVDRLRVYIQATNLFTITRYTGLEPEIISTDDRAAGIDANAYPAVKQYLVGASINF